MSKFENLNQICQLIEDKYGDLGKGATQRLRQWISGEVPFSYPEFIGRHLAETHIDLLFDAFWQVLPFGTGGRRGRVGYGPNRINPTTVGMTVQGHCNYLREAFPDRDDLSVVVANDVRVFKDLIGVYRFLGERHPLIGISSRSLGRLACEIYAGNGIVTYFAEPHNDDAVMTTPSLSYAIGELGAVGGINLSASHNPPDDNGIKVYDHHGSQPVAPDDQHLVDAMERATDLSIMPFEEALAKRMIREIPDDLHRRYLDMYVSMYGGMFEPDPQLPVTYTPLCGCGLKTVGELLTELRFPLIVPPDERPDGSFAAIPLKAPNPEVFQSTAPARAFADDHGSGIVLSSDPDADRVGVEIKLADGSWYHFDGNQIAVVLAYLLMIDPQGPRRKGLVIESLVTTKMLGKIVEVAGDSWIVDDLLVGFKYVADVLKKLKSAGQFRDIMATPGDMVLAAEESHGISMAPNIPDKDSAPACMYLAALYQRLKQEDRTLLDYYLQIIEELGGYDCVNRSIMMSGAEGMMRKDRIMASLRESAPATLSGQPVLKVVDYHDQSAFGPFVSESDKLPRNVLQFFTRSLILTIRPSGTEPKLKLYCQLLPDHDQPSSGGMQYLDELRERADSMARQVYRELLGRIGMVLGEAGLLLPDIIELERKQYFEQTVAPQLEKSLATGSFDDLNELLAWLRESDMTPGTNPLPALKTSIGFLCGQWKATMADNRLLGQLEDWSKS